MKELKTLDTIIKIDESLARKNIIDICIDLGNYDMYNNFFDTAELYEDAGYRINYFYNVQKNEYFLKPIKKHIGFTKWD